LRASAATSCSISVTPRWKCSSASGSRSKPTSVMPTAACDAASDDRIEASAGRTP
jgi:hypothetical protein